MKKETDHPHHKQSYILTCSLAEKMQGLRNIGIEVPPTNASLYGEIQGELSSMIEERIPGVNVVRVEMSELAAQILTKARKEIGKNALIASTCLEIASPNAGQQSR